jgi:hypothetical protein
MSVKEVTILTFPPIQDVMKEMTTCQNVLIDMLSTRFESEHNTETLEYAQKVLDGYCYVPSPSQLWVGRYVRYLDMKDAYRMDLKKGGFCLNDNGYTVQLRGNNNKVFKVSRKDRLWFMVMNDTDLTKIRMNALI